MNKAQPDPKTRRRGGGRAPWGEATDASLVQAMEQVREVLDGLEVAELREQVAAEPRLFLQLMQVIVHFSDARVRYEKRKAEETAAREARREKRSEKKPSSSGIQSETMDRIEEELNLF